MLNPILNHKFEDFRDFVERGWIVAYPTETTYGLGANPFNKEAVIALNKVKQRSEGKPYLMLVKNLDMLAVYAETEGIERFLDVAWPNAVSFILKAKKRLPEWMIDMHGNACFRISKSQFAKKLFEYIDRPLISTSANPEGFPVASDPYEVAAYFQNYERLAVFPDMYNDVKGRLPSTIIDLTKEPPKVVRKGAFNIVF
jgi:L-threonylcarbamoyladenylate synthase